MGDDWRTSGHRVARLTGGRWTARRRQRRQRPRLPPDPLSSLRVARLGRVRRAKTDTICRSSLGSVSRGRSLLIDEHQVPHLPAGGQLRQIVFVSRSGTGAAVRGTRLNGSGATAHSTTHPSQARSGPAPRPDPGRSNGRSPARTSTSSSPRPTPDPPPTPRDLSTRYVREPPSQTTQLSCARVVLDFGHGPKSQGPGHAPASSAPLRNSRTS